MMGIDILFRKRRRKLRKPLALAGHGYKKTCPRYTELKLCSKAATAGRSSRKTFKFINRRREPPPPPAGEQQTPEEGREAAA